MMITRSQLLAAFLLAPALAQAGQEAPMVVPSTTVLGTPDSTQRLLLQWANGGEVGRQEAGAIAWTSSNPAVATVADGVVRPVGDGEATIAATVAGQEATASVKVVGMARPFEPGFREHVEPILAKLGCNSGACHGALAGKGGFRLSLNGYDPDADYFSIVKLDRGRRVEFADPGRSLILAKPSGAIAHKGGVRFATDSRAYRILADWIASGATPPAESDPRVVALEVVPGRSTHKVGETQRIVVRARYTDDRVEDVSRSVKWSSTDETVCRVDQDGVATILGPGEGAVVAWFASRIAIARVTVPYNEGQPAAPPGTMVDLRKPRNFIDEQVDAQLARLNLPASPACDDDEFVRRAWVDTVGRLPTGDETRGFLASTAPDKRDVLVDELLARPEFVDYWTYKWADALMLSSTKLMPDSVKSYYGWLRKQVAANTPWDELVRSILVSTGESTTNGATNFFGSSQSPEEMTENASQAFLGLSIGCARCHNHPLEKWTNDQYYAMANLFARVRAKGWGGDATKGSKGLRTIYVAQVGDLIQPRTGNPQPPTPLDGTPLALDDPSDRRVALADWMTAPDNPYFARAITNRIWANYFGVGLVEKVDDVRASNPASNEALLRMAGEEVIRSKFDLKPLMKRILQSNAYQRSSRTLPGNRGESRFYSRYYPRRMMAEVMHDAIVQVTGVPTKFDAVLVPGGEPQKVDDYPAGTRAIQLFDASVDNYFLQAFGRNPRRIVCECDRSDEPSIVQVLHLSNGDTLNDKLKAPGNRVEAAIHLRRQGMSDAALIDDLYLSSLARYPTEPERARLLELLPPPGSPDERPVVEDVFWGLLSSREFLFNH